MENGEIGTRYDVPEELDENSECSEDLVNPPSGMYGSSIYSDQQSDTSSNVNEESDEDYAVVSATGEPMGQQHEMDQQPEVMHMACVWEFHHHQVDRESNDGEPSQDNKDGYDDYPPRDVGTPPISYEDRDGQLWSYEDEFIPCNNAVDYRWDCESPVERHWVEPEAPEWIQDPDERENSPENYREDDDEEDEDEPTDESLYE
ncbi:hypothetical protein L208DRAFT_1380027 [Tricholoma matsutake]|nr:hypothetical protein L208DRAFT_1380027 [Tricholoma matsutake 945]